MASNVYGIFNGTKFALSANKRRAIKCAKASANHYNHPSELRVFKNCGPEYTGFDYPTFRILSDPLVTFLPTKGK